MFLNIIPYFGCLKRRINRSFLLPLQIHPATIQDQDWVNEQYAKVAFQPSDLSEDYVAMASWQNEPAGLGRLQTIAPQTLELGGMYVFEDFRKKGIAGRLVQHLLAQVPSGTMVYCLPFQVRSTFYENYGFKAFGLEQLEKVPAPIQEKLDWCKNAYTAPVTLLFQQM
jgi:GNAT superfamily N-acetyltransferase